MLKIHKPAALNTSLSQALFAKRSIWLAIVLYSVFVNLLLLTGPIFMLQVYDRVLTSRSVETLVALFGLVAFLYVIMWALDYSRHQLLNFLTTRFQASLDKTVLTTAIEIGAVNTDFGSRDLPKDLEQIRRFLTSPTVFAVIDLPWVPVFLSVLFFVHPLMGCLAVVGGAILVLSVMAAQFLSRQSNRDASILGLESDCISRTAAEESASIEVLGLRQRVVTLWSEKRAGFLRSNQKSVSAANLNATLTKSFRMFLQSATLALGAYLVLQGSMSAGAMIACSILLARALAPLEQTISGWPALRAAQGSWSSLSTLLSYAQDDVAPVKALTHVSNLTVTDLAVRPPGTSYPKLSHVSFAARPGEAIGVIGASSSGKSVLAWALTGLWQPVAGSVRLGGTSLSLLSATERARHIGFLNQEPTLFSATIAENIGGLDCSDFDSIKSAAELAGINEMILALPDGYNTVVGEGGCQLSAGERQRLALARAVHGNPALIVLDEPDAHLDTDALQRLNTMIKRLKAAGKIVLVTSHRPSTVAECDNILVLKSGRIKDAGPREAILKQQKREVQNATEPHQLPEAA